MIHNLYKHDIKKIMIIGAGIFQLPIVQAAHKKYEVILVAPHIDKKFDKYVDQKYLIDVREKEKICAFASDLKIDGVITDQTDISVRTVAYVAEQLGLPGIGYNTGVLFTDKSMMRKKMSELDIRILPNRTCSSLDEALGFYESIGGEIIIKPLDNQGSRGVQSCKTLAELREKYNEASEWSSNGKVIVERLVRGREFFVEGMTYNYEYSNLILGDTEYFKIPDCYAAKQRIVPSTADDELIKDVLDLDEKIITGFGLKQGISHSEYITDGNDIYLIETAARGGGVFISSDLISLSTGLDTEEFLLDIALGQLSNFSKIKNQLCHCGYMAFYIPMGTIKEIKGVEIIKKLEYVHRNQLDELHVGKKIIRPYKDKTSRIAIIVSADSRAELEQRMCYIRQTLVVEVVDDLGVSRGLIWE